MPRWVKVLIVVVVVLVLALVISTLAGVKHGPGMHSSENVPTHTGPPAEMDAHVPPVGHAP